MALSTAVDLSAVARVVGIETKVGGLQAGRVVFLPQRIAVIGQGATAATYVTTKRQVTSALEVAGLYGFGSPLHLAVKQLMPVNGDGVGTIPVTVYPLDDDGSGVASDGDLTVTGIATAAGSFRVRIGGILSGGISVAIGDDFTAVALAIANAVNAELDMPVIAIPTLGVVAITAKWKGSSGDHVGTETIGDLPTGVAVGITDLTGGAVNPDVDDALAQFGNVWETMVLNCMELSDADTLDKYSVFGEARWGAVTRRPMVVFTGTSSAALVDIAAITDLRTTDRVNCLLNGMGSPDTKPGIAGRMLARIVVLANNNPPHDYGGQAANGLITGTDGEQWDYAEQDAAVKAGISTSDIKGGLITIADVVTFYHPAGDTAPSYRYVVDIVKLMNLIFNMDLIFTAPEWNGAPLIPNEQPTTNRSAKKPMSAVAAVSSMLDSLGDAAIISDPKTAKANTFAEIDGSNPKRLNVATKVQLSGNSNIVSVTQEFSFFFGG